VRISELVLETESNIVETLPE